MNTLTKNTTYTLSPVEVALAREVGVKRHASARAANVYNARKSTSHSDYQVDEMGARGELAMAGLLHQEGCITTEEYQDLITEIMDESLKPASTGEDRGDLNVRGCRIDVKASEWGHIAHLWLRDNKLKAEKINAYALVTTMEEGSLEYRFAGLMGAGEVRSRWSEPEENGKFPQLWLQNFTPSNLTWKEIAHEAAHDPGFDEWGHYEDMFEEFKTQPQTARYEAAEYYFGLREKHTMIEESVYYFGEFSPFAQDAIDAYEAGRYGDAKGYQLHEHWLQIMYQERYGAIVSSTEQEWRDACLAAAHAHIDLERPIGYGDDNLKEMIELAKENISDDALALVNTAMDAITVWDEGDEDAIFEMMREAAAEEAREQEMNAVSQGQLSLFDLDAMK